MLFRSRSFWSFRTQKCNCDQFYLVIRSKPLTVLPGTPPAYTTHKIELGYGHFGHVSLNCDQFCLMIRSKPFIVLFRTTLIWNVQAAKFQCNVRVLGFWPRAAVIYFMKVACGDGFALQGIMLVMWAQFSKPCLGEKN